MKKIERRNKLNIEKIREARKEEQNNTPINAKTNVGVRCYASQMRNNINSTHDNNNCAINTCGSDIKPNTTEKEEYLKQPKMLL